jgi:uncharacterized protein YprB with RNaseH-like and TPR domain
LGRKFKNYTQEQKDQIIELHLQGLSSRKICKALGISEKRKADANYMIKAWKEGKLKYSKSEVSLKGNMPKILVLDIETSTTLSEHFGTFKVNIGLDAIVRDWCVLSWAAKWWHEDEVMYEDIRDQFDGSARSILNQPDDTAILTKMWHLLDETDIVVSQNGVRFDQKRLNARFIQKGFKPYRPVKHIDTLLIAKKHFGFTSNKLAYMTDKLCKKYKKLDHGKFAGMKLWLECMIGNPEAWIEMCDYNIYDVLSLQELTTVLAPWSNTIPNLDLYHNTESNMCLCGNDEWEHTGFSYTGLSKFDTFKCTGCGHHKRGRVNLHSKDKMKSLRMNVT